MSAAAWRTEPLGDVVSFDRSTLSPQQAGERQYVGLEHVQPDGSLASPQNQSPPVSDKFIFDRSHILYGKLRPYLRKVARPSFEGMCSTDILPLRPREGVSRDYVFHFLRTEEFARQATARSAGVNLPRISPGVLAEFPIALPASISEQNRIAAILNKADEVRARRRAALDDADALARSTFLQLLGDPVSNPKGWPEMRLDAIADVRSGITKGRRLNGEPVRPVPYMRVANVQDGHIDLSEIKTIDATDGEIARFALQAGDILLTEGGDPDKLGRGAVWGGEVAECIHQNHIFMVRVQEGTEVPPSFLSALIGSARGKSYFLKNAKQTTGIASINRTQLTAFPALVPHRDVLARWLVANRLVERTRTSLAAALADADALYASLAARAFRGEL